MNAQYYHVKNNGSFVGVKMDGTICHARNINFAYPLYTRQEVELFAEVVQKCMPDGQTEVTDNHGNTINQ
jgi:hypothetical protein